MANVSISEITQEITSASELDGNELFLISDVNNSTYTSKKCNLGNIKNYVGTTINNQEKTVSPSTSSQNVTPDTGYTGLSKVTVNAISTQTKSATPSKSVQTISPDSGKYLSSVSISAVTNSIDSNISAGNIKKDVSILGVTGTYSGEGKLTFSQGTLGLATSWQNISGYQLRIGIDATNCYLCASDCIFPSCRISNTESDIHTLETNNFTNCEFNFIDEVLGGIDDDGNLKLAKALIPTSLSQGCIFKTPSKQAYVLDNSWIIKNI